MPSGDRAPGSWRKAPDFASDPDRAAALVRGEGACHHVVIRQDDAGCWRLEDQMSENGCYLNGERVFLRGINYLPTDVYPARTTPARLRAVVPAINCSS